ncbi:pentapeptide repeat-containing protein [Rhodopila sp.]|uniref:pentapeptide repeat-containing protein n=1 Tax=Rhodopila sp. TaxID=2480087 RepID=UPI003D0DA014
MRDCDLFQTGLDGARLDRADLTGAELRGVNLLRLGGFPGTRITATQQFAVLSAMGTEDDP